MKASRLLISATLIMLMAASACTKKDEGATSPNGQVASAPASQPLEKNVVIESVGEQMKFNKDDIWVKADDTITLTFKNMSTTLAHNWVLVKAGKEDDVAKAGVEAGPEKNYVPEKSADVLATTRLVPPKGQKYADKTSEVSSGETTITFKAPTAGDYPFICTNAGHNMVMKGVLHSK